MTTAIVTKFFGPSNVLGSRYKARTTSNPSTAIVVKADHSLNAFGNHAAVAKALAVKLGWSGKWHAGDTANGGYYFVRALPDLAFEIEAE